ncbi:FtsX-like permease family protein [Priestia filamentosa]|uniref:ABC transporter permease n=1 Tax=Priestia filamentosa TaxID=1402861 RepID=UPI002E20ABB1|nr:FtsX-like permease family protein [Priestia filamentosa]MED3725707.1 FtsX-like permease family protein [Priestia filamentosa]
MNFKDQVSFIKRNMKKNRLRVFMTVLATAMSCAFLVVLASIGFGMQKTVTDEILSQQIVTKIPIYGSEKNTKDLSGDLKKDLKDNENVKAIVERTTVNEPIQTMLDERSSENSSLIFTNMKQETNAGMSLSKGRMPTSSHEVIVGYNFASQLWSKKEQEKFEQELKKSEQNANYDLKQPKGFQGNVLNKNITLKVSNTDEETGKVKEKKSYTFKIVGIAKENPNDWVVDSNIFISSSFLSDFSNVLGVEEESFSTDLAVFADKFEHVEQLTQALLDKGYQANSVTQQLDNINKFFTAFKIGLVFVGTIAVIISAIGIFNTMTMAVTERTQEIGIMKAIGAQPKVIQKIFLMESAFIGVLGSIIGIIVSYIVSFGANAILPMILTSVLSEGADDSFHVTYSYIPLSLIIIAVVISAGVAVLSGLRPARKATKTNVLSALRREI